MRKAKQDIERLTLEMDKEAQRVADMNATNIVLIGKIEILIRVLESEHFEPAFKEMYWRKMDELIKRL